MGEFLFDLEWLGCAPEKISLHLPKSSCFSRREQACRVISRAAKGFSAAEPRCVAEAFVFWCKGNFERFLAVSILVSQTESTTRKFARGAASRS
jgi:hypothetical protein